MDALNEFILIIASVAGLGTLIFMYGFFKDCEESDNTSPRG